MTYLVAENNLSDLTDAAMARDNLGLGSIATEDCDMLPALVSTVEDAAVVTHDPTDSSAAGGWTFGLQYHPNGFDNGPVAEPEYVCDVWAIGANAHSDGSPITALKSAMSWRWETRFYFNDQFQHEIHLSHYPAIETPTEHRLLSFSAPDDGSPGNAGMASQVDFIDWGTYAGGEGSARILWDILEGNYDIRASGKFRFDVNNAPVLQQRNVGGSLLNLPYLDSGDMLRISQGMIVIAPRAGSGAVYPGQFVTLQPTSANDGDVVLGQIGPTVTGSLYSQQMYAAASAGLIAALWNVDATHGTAHAYHYIRTNGGNAGDPFVNFQVLGVTDWSIGIDNSDSDKFKISRSAALGTTDKLTLDASGNLFIEGVVRAKSFTVSVLPSASGVGAGATAYASNGRKAGEGSGSGTGIPVWSDGNTWRTFYDNAAAAA